MSEPTQDEIRAALWESLGEAKARASAGTEPPRVAVGADVGKAAWGDEPMVMLALVTIPESGYVAGDLRTSVVVIPVELADRMAANIREALT